MKTLITRTLVLLCLLIALTGTLAAAPLPPSQPVDVLGSSLDAGQGKVAPGVEQALRAAPANKVPIIVTMKRQADLTVIASTDRDERLREVIQLLQQAANVGQRSIRAYLATERANGNAGPVTPFWVFSGLSVSVNAAVVEQLAARPDVARISSDETFQAPALETGTSPPEPNLSAIQAPALWALEIRGEGVVVANVDTGVYLYHPDLNLQWRGGTNSWYDPYNQHPGTPTDVNGHGTQTMGVMVGRDAGGTSIGVAPDAQWIAAKIFNDQGQATTTGIHAAYQWLLDPDGNPQTPDAPHVVNSSWSFGGVSCNLEFQLDMQALRAANILPIFSAGNFGPYSATSASPANYPEAFAVGAVDDNYQIYTYSSRGPSNCGEAQTVFPEMVAPGVNIHTANQFGSYSDATGTSIAAPHVAGALALLLSAYPNLTAQEQADALLAGAVDLGPAGPDNTFGTGRLDVWKSYEYLLAGGPPPTPTPTATPTPTPDPNVNLALNQPVTVSSFKDEAHSGDKAVDGNPYSSWQTAKATGRNVLPAEWIVVDLGSSTSVGAVSLVWDGNYATSYTIQVSDDNSSWATVFATSNGDGGNDAITFVSVAARYVKMDSTAWSSSSQRNWLLEFEIYAADGGPTPPLPPTATPTPPPTATPGPTTTVHVGDLDGSSAPSSRRWDATVVVLVHDVTEAPVVGATVSGTWSNGAAGDGSCVTDSDGLCQIDKTRLKTSVPSVIFTVTGITRGSDAYSPGGNHDPDGDSDGTSISIAAP